MLVRRSDGSWQQPAVAAYENEGELQALVAQSPELVGAGSAVVALREFALSEAGSLDVLLVELDGGITLVEAKLNRNPEIRRAVVGQLLGYAGGLWGMGYDDLDAVVRDREGVSLLELARQVAGEHGQEIDEEGFRATVAANLRAGAFSLVFAVDQVTEDLRRAVEYLNAHLADALDVRVLELAYAKFDDVEILVPQTFGEEAARRKQQARTRRRWSEAEFLEALEERASPEERAAVDRLLEWARPRVRNFYWGEGQTPSCTLVFDATEGPIQPCGVYFTPSGLVFAINFEWMRKRPHAAVEATLERLCALPAIAARRDEITGADFAKRPSVAAAELEGHHIDTLTDALETLLAHPTDA